MKPLTRCIIVLSSCICLLLPKKIARACGIYVFAGEYRFWLMQPDLADIPDLSRLFLATSYFYYEDAKDLPDLSAAANIDEWFLQIKKAASKESIEEVLYNMPPDFFMPKLDSLKKDNAFIRELAKPYNKELLQYLIISKRTESIATKPDPWQEMPARDSIISRIVAEADSLYMNTNTGFVRLRCSYQAMRLHKYNGNPSAAAAIYDQRISKNNLPSWIQGAALYEKAGCMDVSERGYYYSRAFDMNYRRESCVERFRTDSVKQILAFARNDHERTVINAMHALNYKGRSLPQIKAIYAKEPGYRELPFLLLREINKVEDWLLTPTLTDYPPALHDSWFDVTKYNYEQDRRYAKELYQFIVEKLNDSPLLKIIASHLAFTLGDYTNAQVHLNDAKSSGQLTPGLSLQIKINELLLHIATQKKLGPTGETMLLDILQTPNEKLPVHSPGIMKDQLILFVAKKMMQRGEFAKGVMLLARTNRTYGDNIPAGAYKSIYHMLDEGGTATDYDGILAIMDKKNKTPFEEYVANSPVTPSISYFGDYTLDIKYAWDRNRVLDLKSSYYLRHDSLQQALQTLEQIPSNFWLNYPYVDSDPFTSSIYSGHRNEKYEPYCNKMEAVKEMIRLQEVAKTDPKKAALCYLLLGNAHYNLTWHGKNWVNVKQSWSSGEFYYDIKRKPFNDDYFGCARARNYYSKALTLAKDKKMASLSCFLAAECNEKYLQYLQYTKSDTGRSKTNNSYVSLLKKKGFKTDLYDKIVEECHTYDSYRLEVRRMAP